jgi:hypothetical protein
LLASKALMVANMNSAEMSMRCLFYLLQCLGAAHFTDDVHRRQGHAPHPRKERHERVRLANHVWT